MGKYTRKRKGGSYRAPMDGLSKFHLRICTAHGAVTPEYFYVVPDNVFLLLPNSCGVKTTTDEVISDPIFLPGKEGYEYFMHRFFKEGGRTESGARFTVYVPGDILPVHVFYFLSLLSLKEKIRFGYTGIFLPGSLNRLPFLHHPVALPRSNFYALRWVNPNASLPHDNDIAQNFSMVLLTYLREKGHSYREYLKKYAEFHQTTMSYSDCYRLLNEVIPIIPENLLAPTILQTGQHAYSLYDIVDHCKMSKKTDSPLIILMNACRTLQEREVVDFETDETPSKPSMPLIRTLSAAGHTDDKATSLNMKNIQAFRDTKGLPAMPFSVMKHDALFAFLSQTFTAYNPETDSAYKPLLDLIEPFMIILGEYRPFGEKQRATSYMEANIDRIHARETELAAVAAAGKNAHNKAEKAETILRLKRRRESLKATRFHSKSKAEKSNINGKLKIIKEELNTLEK
jgi:hypothetical protein